MSLSSSRGTLLLARLGRLGAYSRQCKELGKCDVARGSSGGVLRAWDEKGAGDGLFFVYTRRATTCASKPSADAASRVQNGRLAARLAQKRCDLGFEPTKSGKSGYY